MPVAAIESIDLDVSHEHGFLVDRFAIEPQAERLSHHAVATITADQKIRVHPFAGGEPGVHSVLILRERRECMSEFHLSAEHAQTVAQDRLCAGLRHHPQVRIRHTVGWLPR